MARHTFHCGCAVDLTKDVQLLSYCPLHAAAPALLEALETLLKNDELGEWESQRQGLPRLTEARALARTAIARAKGETQ